MIDRRAVLLANHGLIAGANNIKWRLLLQKRLSLCSNLLSNEKHWGTKAIARR